MEWGQALLPYAEHQRSNSQDQGETSGPGIGSVGKEIDTCHEASTPRNVVMPCKLWKEEGKEADNTVETI